MAKKAKAQELAVVDPAALADGLQKFNLSGSLDLSDVLSIVVVRAEETYKAGLKSALEVLEAARKDVTATNKAIRTQALADGEAKFADKVAKLKAGLEVFGYTAKISLNGWCNDTNCLNNSGMVPFVVSIMRPNNSATETIELPEKPTKAHQAAIAAHEAAKQHVAKCEAEALEWRRKIQSIPTLERQYKAKIATAKLKTDDGGKALLEFIERDLDQTIAALTV